MKKAIGILINDVHLNKDNVALVQDIFDQLICACKKYNTSNIFIGGDVFTNRSGQPLICLTAFNDILDTLEYNGIVAHVIPGNHDKTDGNDERSYLDVFQSHRGMNLYRNASCSVIRGVNIVFVPYFHDDIWLEGFNFINKNAVDEDAVKILITHSGFDGVMNNDGSKVSSIIKPSMFEDYDNVLIGHYHDRSYLADNVVYTGSAYQNNYGENITDKGFTIIFDDGSIEFIQSVFPKYIKEVIDANDNESLQNLLEKYDGTEDDYIRFIFTGKKVDCQKINISEIQGKYGIDCKFQSTEETEAIELSESDAVMSYDKRGLTKDFIAFCKDGEIKGEKMKYGLELIKML